MANSLTLDKNEQINLIFQFINKLIPTDVLISCSKWAEKTRILTEKVTSRSGPFSFDESPYMREIADCASKNSPVREVAVMKGVQIGYTTSVIENVIGYKIDEDPGPTMFVFPTDKECEEYKKIKIDNLIDNSNLREKILAETENRNTRRTGDTAFMLEFPKGFLKLVSARKGSALRSFPIQNLLFDEVDGYIEEIKNEGSPIDIARKRTDSYSDIRKIFYGSTPTKKHNSKIKELYEKGDRRKYYVPCPFCGEYQELVFYVADGGEYSDDKSILKNKQKTKPYGILFDKEQCLDGNYSSVRYRCKHCGEDIKEYHKKDMELKGEWRATTQSKTPNLRSYHISALYSLTKSWADIVFDYVDAGTDAKKLQTFYNLDLGLPFEERTGGVELAQVTRLKDEDMPNNVIPKDALFLTAACDVQRDRLEVEIKAWGDRFRCWGIDYRILHGNTADIYDPCWQRLAKLKDELFRCEYGDDKYIELGLIDSGDGETRDVVYQFCEYLGEGAWLPCKGFASTVRTKEKYKIVDAKDFEGLSLVEIYVDLYKNTLARCLTQTEHVNDMPYPDYWFTFASGYKDEYFRQLTTEKKEKIKNQSGYVITKWVQHGRNEAFDINVYNLCAADIVIQQYSTAVLESEYPNPREVFRYLTERKEIGRTL